MAMARIWFRAVIDEVQCIVYEALCPKPYPKPKPSTSRSAAKYTAIARQWWRDSLNAGYAGPVEHLTKQQCRTLDNFRYSMAKHRLQGLPIGALPGYKALVKSGALYFLCLSQPDFRAEANREAHSLVSTLSLQKFLDDCEVDKTPIQIGEKSTIGGLCGAIDFLDAVDQL